MIQVLFAVLAAEAMLTVMLLFRTPLRRLVVTVLDKLKRGHRPIVVKTLAATLLVLFAASVYTMFKISPNHSPDKLGVQVLFTHHLLQATLLGYILFLALIIDRLHNYIREIRRLKRKAEISMKQSRAAVEEAPKELQERTDSLQAKLKQLENQKKQS